VIDSYVNPSIQAFLLSENHKSSEVSDEEAISILLSFKKEKDILAIRVQEVLVLLTFINIYSGKLRKIFHF
jgi:hypothetical protein